jgi:hypothetical protein
MAKITIAGTVQLTKSGSQSMLTLWETIYNEQLGKDIKTAYKLWTPPAPDWTDGTSLVIEGRLSVRPRILQDGTPATYVDSKGNTITAHDLNVNDVEVKEVILKNPAPADVDMDDVRKYGTPLSQVIDSQPF